MSLRALLLTAIAVGVWLVVMVGMYWLFDVLPLVAFFGLAAYYAARSSRRAPEDARSSRRTDGDGVHR